MITSSRLLLLGAASLATAAFASQESADLWTQKQLEEATTEIQAQIEELRGQKFTSKVTVELTDEAGLIKYAKARMEATESANSLRADEMTLKLLGLLGSERNYLEETFALLEGQVGGFYDPGSDSFYLMDRFTGGLAKIILAHELTHALDDQLYDIDGTMERFAKTTDSELAYHAVVEGSGLGTMNAWMKANPGEWTVNDLVGAQSLTSGLDGAPAAVWKPLLASYWLGGAFLSKTDQWLAVQTSMKAPEVASVATAFASPPRSTEQLLHPEKYWEDAQRDDPVEIELTLGKLPAGWKVVAQDTLGEMFLALVTTPEEEREGLDMSNQMALLGIKFTNAAARGWGGDHMVLLESETASILHLVTVWDTLGDAEEFEAALEKMKAEVELAKMVKLGGGEFAVERDGKFVTVTSSAGVEGEELAAIVGAVSRGEK